MALLLVLAGWGLLGLIHMVVVPIWMLIASLHYWEVNRRDWLLRGCCSAFWLLSAWFSCCPAGPCLDKGAFSVLRGGNGVASAKLSGFRGLAFSPAFQPGKVFPMDLFSLQEAEAREGFEPGADTSAMPLAARMRPRTLDEVAGQKHLLAPGKLLRRAIETDRFTSLIFYGPPGCGKTTLAAVIARTTNAHFMMLNGVESNVADIREKIAQAQMRMSMHGRKTVLFVDELHRFNKAQQDVLLPHLEKGTVRFYWGDHGKPLFCD